MANHKINTKLGVFRFGWVGKDFIYGRFENPDLAKKVYTCNPFTGKYNFHGKECLLDLMNLLWDLRQYNRL